MEITDVKFEKVVDEPGESIEGYPTRHYQFKSSWKMGMQGMPMKTEISTRRRCLDDDGDRAAGNARRAAAASAVCRAK